MADTMEAPQFPDGARWQCFDPRGFAARGSMQFLGGNAVTGIMGRDDTYVAVNMETGGAVNHGPGNQVDPLSFEEAVTTAEAEALHPTYP